MKQLPNPYRYNPLYTGLLCIVVLFAIVKSLAAAIVYIVGATLKLGVVGIGALLILKVLLIASWLAYMKKHA